jgi:hypothetical protein
VADYRDWVVCHAVLGKLDSWLGSLALTIWLLNCGSGAAHRWASLIAIVVAILVACSQPRKKPTCALNPMPHRPVETVLQEHSAQWMSLPSVAGCGVGEWKGKPCIIIFVTKLNRKLAAQIPREVEGHPVVVEESGPFRALRPQ